MKFRSMMMFAVLVLCSTGLVWAAETMPASDTTPAVVNEAIEPADAPAPVPAPDAAPAAPEAAPAAATEPANKICPISGHEVGGMGEPKVVEYKGKSYNLCCAMCEKDFNKDPEAAIKKLEEAGKAEGAAAEDHTGHDHQ